VAILETQTVTQRDIWIDLFNTIVSSYYEQTDPTDDIDRIFRQEEVNEWLDLLNSYSSGEITAQQLLAWEPDYLADIGGFTDYLTGIKDAVRWENNANFIIDSCTSEAGCNESQQAWYDRWVRSGSPDTRDGMMTQAEYDQYTTIPQSEAEIRTILQNEGYSDEEINDLMGSIVDTDDLYGSTTLSNILRDLGYWEAADQWDVNPKVGSWCTAPDGTIGQYEEGGICVSQGIGSEGDPCGYNNQGTKDSTGQCVGGEDPGVQTVEEMIEQIATEEQVDQSVVEGVADIISTVKGALPTDLEEASDLIKQVLGSTILGSALEECESWTGNTTTDGGLGVPSWTKCVDAGIFGIPGLDLPLPPGMIDISVTVYDIIQAGEDIGESFEDFINDPSGWLENVIDKAVDKVQEVWGDITSGLDPKNSGGLLDILNDWIGNILGGYILNQVKDATEVLDPFLYSGDCANEGFQEPYEGYCDEAVNNDRLVQCSDGSYVNTIDECPEGAFVDEGPTPEECTQQGRAHIPGNPSANPPTQSECGDCLGGFSEVDKQCVEGEDPITNQGPTAEECLAQKREFIAATDVADSSCGECLGSYEDINGECTEKTPTPEPCLNNATTESGCEQCSDGSAPSAHIDGDCSKGLIDEGPEEPPVVDPECNDCSCPEYANDPANFLECGGDPECNDCSCPEYAAANPLECGGDPECNDCTCDDYAAANPLECGWEECPDGSFAPTLALCGSGGEGCPEGTVPCATLGGECTTPEACPGTTEEEEEAAAASVGGGDSKGSLFEAYEPKIGADPQLLARQEFPITDFLMGLFTGK
jgi:hypothetical protein